MATTVRIDITRAETNLRVTLEVHDCPSCGVIYAIPLEFGERRRADAHTFYCPNGHTVSYAETEKDKLRKALASAERDRDWYKASEADQREWRGRAERSLAATRGQVTKMRKRAVAGTCPFGCRRHFVNLERHVATKHEGQTFEAETS